MVYVIFLIFAFAPMLWYAVITAKFECILQKAVSKFLKDGLDLSLFDAEERLKMFEMGIEDAEKSELNMEHICVVLRKIADKERKLCAEVRSYK
jgi:hypothetical protein